MRTRSVVVGLGLTALLAQRMAPAVQEGLERVLLDAPRGAWMASVRADAALTVVEERDGWRKVRIEGWTRIDNAAGPATSPPSTALPSAVPSVPAVVNVTPPPVAAPAGAPVKGALVPLPGQTPETPGARLLVLLVGDLESVSAAHATLGEECKEGAAKLDSRVAELNQALRKALNSSDNFTAAAKANDRVKSELARARKERADYVESCRDRADALFESHTVKRAITDVHGGFEFSEVAAGAYWVIASEHRGETVRAWWMDCRVLGPETVVLDPRAAAPVGDPYWGLR